MRVAALLAASVVSLTACNPGFDLDMRGNVGGLDTSGASQSVAEPRPTPDANGLITYPTYQVAVARRGDQVADVAARVGVDANALAAFNGRPVDDALNEGEILALPDNLENAPGQPVRPDIASIAGSAIDRAQPAARTTAAVTGGQEPVRHRVTRGETAFSISRLYGVSPRSLADWNGLGADMTVREGQFLLIPVVVPGETDALGTAAPGQGSVTPLPPSSSSALPENVEQEPLPESPNLDASRSETQPVEQPSQPQPASGEIALRKPVNAAVTKPFSRRNEGLSYGASAGSTVSAAAAGEVAAITRSTDQVPILVIRHPGNYLTVYANIDDLTVKKGDRVAAGQKIAEVRATDNPSLHFELRRGFDAIDPTPFFD